MSYLDQLTATIDARIAAIRREIASLESARAALDGRSRSASRRRRGRAASGHSGSRAQSEPPRSSGRARRRRLAGPELTELLERMLGESAEGLSAVTLAKRADAGYGQVLEQLRALEQAGRVRRTGERRTSLWRLVTEDELIAERAAELERLARSA